ncbi:MAG: hypothetical protein EPO01_12295 [Aquabacterium sp.]|nr:MAG: hypothetical protein EPO01_12295 [Aquabacterium sp.]
MPYRYEALPSEMRARAHAWEARFADESATTEWTVDHETDSFLLCLSLGRTGAGGGAWDGSYVFVQGEQGFGFKARRLVARDEASGRSWYEFLVRDLDLPAGWVAARPELQAQLRAALVAMQQGIGGQDDSVVSFSAQGE